MFDRVLNWLLILVIPKVCTSFLILIYKKKKNLFFAFADNLYLSQFTTLGIFSFFYKIDISSLVSLIYDAKRGKDRYGTDP